jgi:hypothetical protein
MKLMPLVLIILLLLSVGCLGAKVRTTADAPSHPPAYTYQISHWVPSTSAGSIPDGYYKIDLQARRLPVFAIASMLNRIPFTPDTTDCSIRGTFLEYAFRKNGYRAMMTTTHLASSPPKELHVFLKVYEKDSFGQDLVYYINPSDSCPGCFITSSNPDWQSYIQPWYESESIYTVMADDAKHGVNMNFDKEYAWWKYPGLRKLANYMFEEMGSHEMRW